MVVVTICGGAVAQRGAVATRLIGALADRGRRVAVIAASDGPLGIDEPGKDSYEHAAAGAQDVLTVSEPRWARVHRNATAAEPRVAAFTRLVPEAEVVLALGFAEPVAPRLVVEDGPARGAGAGLRVITEDGRQQVFRLDKPEAIADLIERLSEETR